MKSYKTKSLTPSLTDEQLEAKGGYSVRFISFEAAIRAFQKEYKIEDKPIGYKVTEQGIEIIY